MSCFFVQLYFGYCRFYIYHYNYVINVNNNNGFGKKKNIFQEKFSFKNNYLFDTLYKFNFLYYLYLNSLIVKMLELHNMTKISCIVQ